MQHNFFWTFPLALIPYPRFNCIPLFCAADIVGSTAGDVWDEMAPSSTHLSQHVVYTLYEVNNADAFVFKRRKVMEPTNDGIDEGEKQEGSHESGEGPQDSEIGHDSNDGEQGSDEETNSSNDGEDSSEHAQFASAIDGDDDIFDATGGITFFHLFSSPWL